MITTLNSMNGFYRFQFDHVEMYDRVRETGFYGLDTSFGVIKVNQYELDSYHKLVVSWIQDAGWSFAAFKALLGSVDPRQWVGSVDPYRGVLLVARFGIHTRVRFELVVSQSDPFHPVT